MRISPIFAKLASAQAYKLSSEVVDSLERVLQGYEDTPEAFEKRLIRGRTRPRNKNNRHAGRTPRTSLVPRHPFDHVLQMHDEYAKNNGHDFGLLGEYPFR